jgi:MFS family permease
VTGAHVAPSTYRDALRSGEFRGLVVAQVLSEWGDYIARVALATVVLARTDSAFLAVLAFVVSFVPAVFGAPLLGGLADRLSRKLVLLVCDLGRGLVIAVLALLAVDGTPVWVLLAVLLVAEFFSAPFDAALRSVVADVLPEPRTALAGMGLLRVLFQLDQVIGIALAGTVIFAFGARVGLFIDAATFVVSFVVVMLTMHMRPGLRDPAAKGSFLEDFRSGVHLVFEDPALRALVLFGWGAAVVIIAPEAVALAYARHEGKPPQVGALLMASVPAGAALGAHLLGRLPPMRQVRSMMPLAVFCCLPLLATSLAPPWWATLVLFFVSGLGQAFMLPLIATVGLMAPAAFRGRVNGLAAGGFSLASAAAYLLAGALADLTSPAVAVTAGGVLGLGLLGAVHRCWPAGAIRRSAGLVYAVTGTPPTPPDPVGAGGVDGPS